MEGPFRQETVSGKSMDRQRDPRGEHSSADAQRTSRNSWALGMMLLAVKPPRP